MGRSRRGSVSSSASESSSTRSDMSSSESDNEVLKRHMKIDEPVLYCEGCNFKTGSKFNLRYNTFGITNNSIVFYGSFSVKKKRKIIPFKAIKQVEWCDDDSVKLIVPRENKDKPKTYHINFKKSHKGSPFRLIESRWNASKIDSSTRLSTGEELYRNPSTQNLLRHFQNIPRDERLELSYRCRIKGSLEQNYGVMFVTQTRILFLSIDTTFKSEEIKFEKILDISESLPSKGKLKKSILITVGKNQIYSFSSFDNKEETLTNLKRSFESYKKQLLQQQKSSINRSSSSTSTTQSNNNSPTTSTATTTTPTTPKVYAPETPLPQGSKNSTWTSVKAPQPTTTSPLTTPTTTTTTTTTINNTSSPKPTTTATQQSKPPTTPLLPTNNEKANYGDRASKIFPKETQTELKQKEEIKQKGTVDKSRRCCSLLY